MKIQKNFAHGHGIGRIMDDKYAFYDVVNNLSIPICTHHIFYDSDNNNDYAREVQAKLLAKGVRVELDLSNESVGKKIRNAVMTKSPYVLVLGDKEMAEASVAVRARGNKDTVSMSYIDFENELLNKINNKTLG